MDQLLNPMKGASLNLETLLEVTNALNSQRDLESLWRVIADQIQKVIPWDRAGITLYEPANDHFRFYAVLTNMATPALRHDAVIPRDGARANELLCARKSVFTFSDSMLRKDQGIDLRAWPTCSRIRIQMGPAPALGA